jgi:hypothetical protein
MSPALLSTFKKVSKLPKSQQSLFVNSATYFLQQSTQQGDLSPAQVREVKKRLSTKNRTHISHDAVWKEIL